MNRRQFFGAMIAPVGAIVAAKTLPIGYVESTRHHFCMRSLTKLMRWFDAGAPPMKIDPAPVVLQTRFHDDRQWHQEQMNVWLRDKVDEAAFNMMKGEHDGKG